MSNDSVCKQPEVKAFYDDDTSTLTYVVFDPQSRDAIVIDPVWDYEPASSKISTESVDKLAAYLRTENFNLHFCLETHAHADHLSGAQGLKTLFPQLKLGIGAQILKVQERFKQIYNLPESFIPNGKHFDFLIQDNEQLRAGTLSIKCLYTPGHTPACSSYLIGDAVFTGDALFMPDSGTGRCDFPMGSSDDLFRSVTERLYTLPDSTRVFVGHDYQADGTREPAWESTIAEQKEANVQLAARTEKDSYIKMRDKRDSTLAAPRLLLPSLQVNIRAGRLPEPEANGTSYLKIPVREKK